MPRSLVYLPVERYKSRWTEYVSGPDGMFARCCKDAGVELLTFSGINTEPSIACPIGASGIDIDLYPLMGITDGVVLDTKARASWAFVQTMALLHMIQIGVITNDSVIYIEDFWHPGFEMIPYACHLAGIRPKVYAFCHAQSVDPNDFTHEMRYWMRAMERGWAGWLTGIFVADGKLKEMMIWPEDEPGGVSDSEGPITTNEDKIHVTGTVFNRSKLLDIEPGLNHTGYRIPAILFTSRLDAEKCPEFFLRLAEYHDSVHGNPDWRFWILSGREVPFEFKHLHAPKWNVTVFDNVQKKDYLNALARSAVMVNAAKQDFVGYCQLDALAYGCAPLCPDYLTFPALFDNNPEHLYKPGNVEDAYQKLKALVEKQVQQPVMKIGSVPELFTKYGSKYEKSVERMMEVMFA
jgi:hypothetical protein